MKRIRAHYPEAVALGLFDAFSHATGHKIGDSDSADAFMASIQVAIDNAADSPILIHGQRTEKMFGLVVASLHGSKLVREEDAGEIYANDPTLHVPDYRLVLNSGESVFVEVKNCNARGPDETLRFRQDYVDGLERYGAVFGLPVKIAVYWAKWRLWTLTSTTNLGLEDGKRTLNLLGAIKTNEMAQLGDFMIGTNPPLTMRLVADRTKDRVIRGQTRGKREVGFTIADIEFYSDKVKVIDEKEKALAFYLIMFGDWRQDDPCGVYEGEELTGIDFTCTPDEFDPAQGFAVIGYASSMISNVLGHLTVDDGEVARLTPKGDPGSFGMLIDPSYKGIHLPLWRFYMEPRKDE